MTCEPLRHDWEVIEVCGNTEKYHLPNEMTTIKFRCKVCLASITGEIIK